MEAARYVDLSFDEAYVVEKAMNWKSISWETMFGRGRCKYVVGESKPLAMWIS